MRGPSHSSIRGQNLTATTNDTAPATTDAAATLPFWTKISYGIGAIAFGVKDNGFSFFLLIFYSQVVGVDHNLVGIALTIALMIDAIADPIVGYWSDNFRSKWGRRHPFMYASAIPLAATYYLMWAPPVGWSGEALFYYVLVLAVLIRILVTFYEIPSSAIAPELTDDYNQRSSLISYRFYFQWTGGNAMSVLMFMALFPAFATAAIPNGQFNRGAYEIYGIVCAVLIFATIMISALGTHSRIPYLKAPPPKRQLALGTIFREIFETLSDRSFVALFVATIFGAIGAGLSAALTFYIASYFWGFSAQQIGILTLGVFASAVIGALLAPVVSRTIGKKRGAMIIGIIAFLGSPLPIVLRLAGILPDGQTDWVFWFVFIAGTIDVGLIICFQILAASMMADLAEQAEVKTGRRSEGIFVAAITFVRKMVTGLGIMAATLVLTLAEFPVGAAPAEVPPEATTRLALYYVPSIVLLWMAMMVAVSTYRLTKSDHEENLRQLAERRSASS
jgi:glycoside/pentoside/hexuronide:cation symporter, GPH family